MDVIHGLNLRIVGEKRDKARSAFNRVERHALQWQRLVGAEGEWGEVGLHAEHLTLARLEPIGVNIKILN